MSNQELVMLTDEELISKSKGRVRTAAQFTIKQEYTYKSIPGGLYDAGIFGVRWRCPCGFQKKVGVCPRCGSHVVNESEFYLRFGYYQLFAPVIYWNSLPTFYQIINELNPSFNVYLKGKSEDEKYKNIWNTKVNIIQEDEINDEDLFVVDNEGIQYKVTLSEYTSEDSPNDYIYYGAYGFYNLFYNYKPINGSFDKYKGVVHKIFMIAPAGYREATVYEDKLQIPPMTISYSLLINYCDIMIDRISFGDISLADKIMAGYVLNNMTNQILKSYPLVRTSKESHVRMAMTSRVKGSGRANIIGIPDLAVDKVVLPKAMLYEILNADIINQIKYNDPNVDAYYLYKNPNAEVMKIFEDIAFKSVYIVGRQPSLHEYSAFALKLDRMWDFAAIGISDSINEPYNADYDGDQMYVLAITKEPEITNALESMSPKNNWYYNKNKKAIFTPKNSFLLGLNFATTIKRKSEKVNEYYDVEQIFEDYESKKIKFDEFVKLSGESTSYGREYVSKILGIPLYTLIQDNPINSKNIANIMAYIGAKPENTEILNKLNDFGRKIVTKVGVGGASLRELFMMDPDYPEIDKIINSKMPEYEKWVKIDEILPKLIKERIEKLPSGMLSSIMKGGGKLKLPSLAAMFGPKIEFKDGKCRVVNQSLLSGYDQETGVSHATDNRVILDQKAAQVPISGYIMRQTTDLNMDIVFKSDRPSADKIGIYLPRYLAHGRTTMDGEILSKSDSKELVKVKSCATSGVDYVTLEELDRNYYHLKNNSPIGISQSTSMMEQVIQTSLGLKHGGSTYIPSDKNLTLNFKATNITVTGNILKVEDNGVEKLYPIPDNRIMSYESESGIVNKGNPIYYLYKELFIDHNLAEWHAFIGAAQDRKIVTKVETKHCYAYNKGVIKYNFKDGTFTIGSMKYPIYKDEVYYYADGDSVNIGDRLCSGVQSLSKLSERLSDQSYVYYIYLLQSMDIIGSGISMESLEILYKGLCRTPSYSMAVSNRKTTKLFTKLSYGYTGEALKSNVNKPIEDSFLYRLFFEKGNLDTYPNQ